MATKTTEFTPEMEAEVVEWAINHIEKYGRDRKLYNIFAIVLSVLDVVCGVIAIFYTGMLVTSVVASIICGTIWSGRFIQLVKTEKLAESLKALTTASLTYIAVRKKRGEFMQTIIKNIKNNPITIVLAIIGAGVMGYAGYHFSTIWFVLPTWANILIAVAVALVTIALVCVLGWDTVKSAIMRTASKTLSEENFEQVATLVETLTAEQKDNAISEKEYSYAKSIVDAFENAKSIVEKYEADAETTADATETK